MKDAFSRRDFIRGMAAVTAAGLLAACSGGGSGGNSAISKLAFVALDGHYDQGETPGGYVLCQEFEIKNQSLGDVTLDGVLDEKALDADDYNELEASIRKLWDPKSSIAAKTTAGTVPCIAVLDNRSNKTLKPGEKAFVYLFAVAPINETTLDILYQGIHQCYLSYGKGLPNNQGGGSAGSNSTASSAASGTETASAAAASEVGVIEEPAASFDNQTTASR